METTFYHEDDSAVKMTHPENTVGLSQLKRNLTLDFARGDTTPKRKTANVLQSPDLNILKLGSPELERMIVQNGVLTTTPTPTQFIYPKFVTEEQEAYARGFVDALNELHHQDDSNEPQYTTLKTTSILSQNERSPPIFSQSVLPPSTSMVTLSAGAVGTTCNGPAPVASRIIHLSHESANPNVAFATSLLARVKDEPQTVPCMGGAPQTVPCLGATPPISPLNMDNQEQAKVDRKRARNRLAARKCRTRKLERITRLEDHVSKLKAKNSELVLSSVSLREQVCKLKQEIMDHINGGCRVVVGNSDSSIS